MDSCAINIHSLTNVKQISRFQELLPIIVSYQAYPKTIQLQSRHYKIAWSIDMTAQPEHSFYNIIGRSPEIRRLIASIRQVAASPYASVLILGESGTGKELVARAIHAASINADQAFVEINCTTLPDNLLETELFGYEKGAYTDARKSKKGLLELADGGTFFLDEIGDLHIQLQAKLLKVLDEHVFRRVGGVENIEVSLRIIAATNRNLLELVQQRQFREDLYYRLDVITIQVPPLRERGDDIFLLAEHFRKQANQDHRKQVKGFTPAARDLLQAYPWPGNVRELKNRVERAVLLNQHDVIDADDLNLGAGHVIKPAWYKNARPEKLEITIPPHGISFDELERTIMSHVLRLAGGNVSKAARLLRLSRETMRYRIKKHGLNPLET